jgi:hypothetical protein
MKNVIVIALSVLGIVVAVYMSGCRGDAPPGRPAQEALWDDVGGNYDGTWVDPDTGTTVTYSIRNEDDLTFQVGPVTGLDTPDSYTTLLSVDADYLANNPPSDTDPVFLQSIDYADSGKNDIQARAMVAVAGMVGNESTQWALFALADKKAPPKDGGADSAKEWKRKCNQDVLDCLDDCGEFPKGKGKIAEAKWAACVAKCVLAWHKCKKECKEM